MNEQPSSLSLTIGESPPKNKILSPAIKMPEVFSLSHPIPCCSCVFLCAEQETKRRLARESSTMAADDVVLYTLVDGGWQFAL